MDSKMSEIEARKIIDNWIAGARAVAWMPGSSFVLANTDIRMAKAVADTFGVKDFDFNALSAFLSARNATNLTSTEYLSFIPVAGWIIKASIQAARLKFIGENIIEYFKDLAIKQNNASLEGNQSDLLDQKYLDLASSLNRIADQHKAEKQSMLALKFYRDSLKISEDLLDPQHPDLVTSYNNIAELYKDQGQYEEALTFYQKAIKIREAILDPQHPDLATSYNNIAGIYQAQGRYESALSFYQKAIEILQKSLGGQHKNTKQGIKNLELFKREMEKREE